MANELMTVIDNLPAELKLMLDASFAHDLEALGTKTLRLPKVKIGHANQTISLPNGELARELECFVVSSAHFMEYYEKKDGDQDEESKAPICASINYAPGFRYGDCNQCPKFEWKPNPKNPDKQLRECASTFRLLVAIKGMKTPVELKIPQTSAPGYAKATKEAMASNIVPTVLMNLKISLTGKKEGSTEWSVFEFKYSPMTADSTEDYQRKVSQRLEMQKKYMTYFNDVYGAVNIANANIEHDSGETRKIQAAADSTSADAPRRPVTSEPEFVPTEEVFSENETDLDSVDM